MEIPRAFKPHFCPNGRSRPETRLKWDRRKSACLGREIRIICACVHVLLLMVFTDLVRDWQVFMVGAKNEHLFLGGTFKEVI